MVSAPKPVIRDVRGLIARQPVAKFGRRVIGDIAGVVFHQELGPGDVYSVARYHTSLECHISPGKGCPSICYTYFIDTNGDILWCNDLEDITWSQGSASAPIEGTRSNTNYLAVVYRGDFTGPDHTGKSEPTKAQLEAGASLWRWLRDMLHLHNAALFGHCDFGKPACPGDTIMSMVRQLHAEPETIASMTPTTVETWQAALVSLGYDIGSSGVDGDWGAKSQAALIAFQTASGIPRSGSRDDWTARKVAEALLTKGVVPPTPRKRRVK